MEPKAFKWCNPSPRCGWNSRQRGSHCFGELQDAQIPESRLRAGMKRHWSDPRNFLLRRDQRTVCLASRVAGRPCPPLDHPPFHSADPRTRHERAPALCRNRGGLPSAARQRAVPYGCDPLCAPLRLCSTSPLTDRRPKPKCSHWQSRCRKRQPTSVYLQFLLI
jgi:hypothetical protein